MDRISCLDISEQPRVRKCILSRDDYKNRRGILALPISRYAKTTPKSVFKADYPTFPETLGQHIRKRRMDLGLFQKDIAEIVGTSIDSITFWENGRAQPQIHFFPKIISFLGYYPFDEV